MRHLSNMVGEGFRVSTVDLWERMGGEQPSDNLRCYYRSDKDFAEERAARARTRYETMVFGPGDGWSECFVNRYPSAAQAERGHRDAMRYFRSPRRRERRSHRWRLDD